MSTELRENISKCDNCLEHHTGQAKEPLMQHDVVARPWSKVGADLCEVNNRTLLVLCDYYNNFIEVARLNTVTSHSVIREMKATFARYGILDIVLYTIQTTDLSFLLLSLQSLQRRGCLHARHPDPTIYTQMERWKMQ